MVKALSRVALRHAVLTLWRSCCRVDLGRYSNGSTVHMYIRLLLGPQTNARTPCRKQNRCVFLQHPRLNVFWMLAHRIPTNINSTILPFLIFVFLFFTRPTRSLWNPACGLSFGLDGIENYPDFGDTHIVWRIESTIGLTS